MIVKQPRQRTNNTNNIYFLGIRVVWLTLRRKVAKWYFVEKQWGVFDP